ncbi:ArpU family phage packaging/lysis transcriptional regulator [Longirhabdus pacifica]|uniref:ArpU family phage packaging/lysis transcriptional regulator n=1 Tax=Longirhabdus pacifica TaxID=2305227 RepID=UPI001F0BF886|nr:ArpU family phage packaging/lysis transcriptional regulator [Longirhabdus pacifica]
MNENNHDTTPLGRMNEMNMIELPQLDKRKTQRAIESIFEKYTIFHTVMLMERVPQLSLTTNYEARMHGSTNKVVDQTADAAIQFADAKMYCDVIEQVVDTLPSQEQTLIKERYISQDHKFDYQIYHFVLEMSEATYYKLRWNAFYKLALSFCSLGLLQMNELVIP